MSNYQDDTKGLYVPSVETLYVMANTKWANHQLDIDRLRKILLAKGILNFQSQSLTGNKVGMSTKIPVIMSVKDAKAKDYKIEEIYGTSIEKKRVEESSSQEQKQTVGRFKKK